MLTAMITRLAGRDLERRLAESGAGLSCLQYGVLRLLGNRTATLSDVSSHMLLSPATLVPVVDALQRRGLIERGLDPSDRRRTPLSLTASGTAMLAQAPHDHEYAAMEQVLESMGSDKSQLLRGLLGEMLAKLFHDDRAVEKVWAALEAQHDSRGPSGSGGSSSAQDTLPPTPSGRGD